jgi:hypothetical protein
VSRQPVLLGKLDIYFSINGSKYFIKISNKSFWKLHKMFKRNSNFILYKNDSKMGLKYIKYSPDEWILKYYRLMQIRLSLGDITLLLSHFSSFK